MKPDNTPPTDRPVGPTSPELERPQLERGQRSMAGGTYGDFSGSPSYKPPSEGGVGQPDATDDNGGEADADAGDDSVAGEEDPGAADDVAGPGDSTDGTTRHLPER